MAATGLRLTQCLEEVSHWMSANRLNADKTELLWAGSKYSQLSLGSKGLPLQIDSDTITASDHVRVLGVTFSADLSLDKHVYVTCALCFFWLRQFRRVRRSLDDESMKTLVHAFVTAPFDYCNMVLASSPRSLTDKLQRMLNPQVRPLTVIDFTCRLALARCGRSGPVQARCYRPPVSPQQSAAVSGRLLRSSFRQTSPVVSDYVPHVVAC